MVSKWDARFLELAKHVAQWSKDPSTKCGAVITQGNKLISVGYNGFPPEVEDTEERLTTREIKYKIVLHAEDNALAFAGPAAYGGTLYVSGIAPCTPCASKIIRAGIARVVTDAPHKERWAEDNALSAELFRETLTQFEWIQDDN